MKKANAKRLLAFFIATLMVLSACLTITINAVDDWDYADEGTGMPDPDDPNEGLPFTPVKEYKFTYKPSIYGYGTNGDADLTSNIVSAKAGDVIWVKMSATDINQEKLSGYDGLNLFEGYITYDVEKFEPFYGDKVVSSAQKINAGEIRASKWIGEFYNLGYVEGMYDDIDVDTDMTAIFTPSNPCTNSNEYNGYGLHFLYRFDGIENGVGVINDDQFYICLPFKISDVLPETGDNDAGYTFTMPYPNGQQYAMGFTWDGGYAEEFFYARGGAYTIKIDNHDDVEDNLADNAVYAIAPEGVALGEASKGFLNDLRYPLTEVSDYTVIKTSGGTNIVSFELDSLSTVNELVLTFNDTADCDLPYVVEAIGVRADGSEVPLGTATAGVAYDEGIVDSTNYGSAVTVNAANAYLYTINNADTSKYTKVYFKVSGDTDVALGEVEIKGEAAKVQITIENGVIENADPNNMYYPGTQLTVIADDIPHKDFVNWTSDFNTEFADDEATTTIYVVGNVDDHIVANYEDTLYDVTVNSGSIAGSIDSVGSFVYDASVEIEAAPAEDGKVFDKWVVVEGAIDIVDEYSANTTVIVKGDAEITATYKDCYNLIVENGSGSGSYVPNGNAEISADAAAYGEMFYKWVVVEGDVDIADDRSASTTVTVNSDATVKATYVVIYKEVPENLVGPNTPVYVETGSVKNGYTSYVSDQLYPLVLDANWLTVSDAKAVVLALDLGAAYDISSTAFNFIIPEASWLTDEITVYGANSEDYSDKVAIGSLKNVHTSTDYETLTFEDGVDLVSKSYRFTVDTDNTTGYRYVVIELSTDYVQTIPGYGTITNETIMVGEIEVYGEATRYNVEVEGGSISDYSDEPTDKGFLPGTVITIVPDQDTEDEAFESWTASVGEVEKNDDGTYTYVVENAATITANFVEINKPVPENLVPGSSVTLMSGSLTAGDESYINDRLYPMTSGAKWNTYVPANKEISFMIDLGDYYDITSGSITFSNVDAATATLLPQNLYIKGTNNTDGSGAVQIGELKETILGGFETIEFADFGVDTTLSSVAVKYDIEISAKPSYRYIIVTATTDYASAITGAFPNHQLKIGEIEIYGEESKFEVLVENGSVTGGSADNLYNDGEVLTIVADEIAHKNFIGWIVEGAGEIPAGEVSSSTATFVVGNGDAVIKAQYDDIYYTLTVVNGTGGGNYLFDTKVEIMADSPSDPELVFDKWVVTEGAATIEDANNPQTKVTIAGNAKVEAVYKNRVYGLTVENGTGSGDYKKGEVVTIVADAPAADMKFDHWEVISGSAEIADATSATTTVTTSNEATTVRAVYTDVLYSVTVNDGKITDGENEDGYKVGTQITITADEIEHKVFDHWVVDGNGNFANDKDETTVFTTGSGDMTITAVYVDAKYDLTVENGSGTGSYVYDESVEISADSSALPGDYYEFKNWEVVSGEAIIADPNSADTTVTVKGDAVIKANFTQLYKVTVINGSLSKEEQFYAEGDVVDIVADDAPEYKKFAGWVIEEGNATIADPSKPNTSVTIGVSDIVLKAEYVDILYKLTVEFGTAEGNGEDGNPVGTEVELTADKAPDGYVFDKWIIVSGEGEFDDESSSVTTFTTAGADTVVRATYKVKGSTPATGDNGIAAFAIFAVVAALGCAVVLKKKR